MDATERQISLLDYLVILAVAWNSARCQRGARRTGLAAFGISPRPAARLAPDSAERAHHGRCSPSYDFRLPFIDWQAGACL